MMNIKGRIALWLAKNVVKKTYKTHQNALKSQTNLLLSMVRQATHTRFGRAHHFADIKGINDYQQQVPVTDYEGLKSYVEAIKEGAEDVLWYGKPLYFAKTSGTTSGVKYIPITKASMPFHIKAARNALLFYVNATKNIGFINGKMIFLQGSPEMTKLQGISVGRLSGIVAHHVPAYLQKNRLPSYSTNCIEDWEAKVDAIVEETGKENMTLISGIPPWVQMYFDKLSESFQNKPIQDIFPKFSLLVYGGVNFAPYRDKLFKTIGKKIDSIETYPASEGFIAFQDQQNQEGLLLNLDGGIFYEFIPASTFFDEQPIRLTIADVEINSNYVIVLTTNAGLWAYNIGDTVKFVSINPYRIVVTGRIKHFISAFGEHVIAEEVERAMDETCKQFNLQSVEFTLAPQVNPDDGTLPYHEWFIEFENNPANIQEFENALDIAMRKQNSYYDDLITGNVLQCLKVRVIQPQGFIHYMKSIGKLGGQNKLPRLSNDRAIADAMKTYIIS